MIEEIGIIDIRKIISTIQDTYNINFGNYALTSLRRRFLNTAENNKISSVDNFVAKIKEDSSFFEKILFDVSISSTEMFRDPSVWRTIRKLILSKVESQISFKIWLPEVATGEELYSLAILLKEQSLLEKVKIYASSLSKSKIDFVKEGIYKIKREDINSANYLRAKGKETFEQYYKIDGVNLKMDTKLIENVEFIHAKSINEKVPEGIKLVLFRDIMIYYTKTYQNIAVDTICNSLLTGGYLILGIKENLNSILAEKKFKNIDDSERIFQKIIS
jgi:chemotaxis protein methyltransferase CheR